MATGYMGSGDMSKGLYAAPVGLEEAMGPDIEIEVEDPESMSIGIDGIEIDLKPQKETAEDFDAKDRKSTRLNSSHT